MEALHTHTHTHIMTGVLVDELAFPLDTCMMNPVYSDVSSGGATVLGSEDVKSFGMGKESSGGLGGEGFGGGSMLEYMRKQRWEGGKVYERSMSNLGEVGRDMEGTLEMAGGIQMFSNSFKGGSSMAMVMGSADITMNALQKFLPSNNDGDFCKWLAETIGNQQETSTDEDIYSCDEFRMYEFKVRRCMRGRSHDWTECPFAHPGEKARRRDPRRFLYSGSACPDFRKGSCRRGDSCEFAHGVFECWLHPSRYRTQICKDGKQCKRRVCFFAHSASQLRLFPQSSPHVYHSKISSVDASRLSHAFDDFSVFDEPCSKNVHHHQLNLCSKLAMANFCASSQLSSPTSTLVGHTHSPPPLSPPLSPSESPPNSPSCWNNAFSRRISCLSASPTPLDPHFPFSQFQPSTIASAQNNCGFLSVPHGPSPLSSNSAANRRHFERLGSMPPVSIPPHHTEAFDEQNASNEVHSTQDVNNLIASLQQLEMRHADEGNSQWSSKLPAHFSRSVPSTPNSRWAGQVEQWDVKTAAEPSFQRVESGRELRAKIYGKLGKDTSLESESPDLGWVNELVK